jgi:hypothetical protein
MKNSQASRILEYLRNHPEGAYNFELARDFSLRYSARIFELRRDGWNIREDFKGHYIIPREPVQQNFL